MLGIMLVVPSVENDWLLCDIRLLSVAWGPKYVHDGGGRVAARLPPPFACLPACLSLGGGSV